MKILIVGNMGYVGSTLVKHLREVRPGAILHGFDAGYFANCLTNAAVLPESVLDLQMFGDVRQIGPQVVQGYDAIVQLAAISNDPMGHEFAVPTMEINNLAAVSIARAALDAGVSNFVYASSCSIYGVTEGDARSETDPVAPMTAYAQSKIRTEQQLAELPSGMTVTCLRFATACGMSDRVRLDLVLNDFVAGALTTGELSILSDGTPWRPLIDTLDMARAIDWAIDRPASAGGAYLVVNAGSNDRNYQVKDLAQAVMEGIPGTRVKLNRDAPVDSRSYKVNFDLFHSLAPNHQPVVTLAQSINRLYEGLTNMGFVDSNYRQSQMIRLRVLERHIAEGRMTRSLGWVRPEPVAPMIYSMAGVA